MKESSASYRNLWALTVMCMLRESPMHPYEMQRLIRERNKGAFLDLKRGSLYHAVGRLVRAGLIEPMETTREGRRPERTVYQLTTAGEHELLAWLRELLARPTHDASPFFAAVSFLPQLDPADVREQLSTRAGRLEAEVAALDSILHELIPRIGRLVLVESEYTLSMRRAELAWVKALIADIDSGKLAWSPEAIRAYLAAGKNKTSVEGRIPPARKKKDGRP